MTNKESINYYENEYFKIKIKENKFKDIFNIFLNSNVLKIKRLDANIGWGQDLKLIVHNKLNNKKDILIVGSSKENIKSIDFLYDNKNFKGTKYYYENDRFKIYYISYLFDDTFKIDYNEDSKTITVKRTDTNKGWGQDLYLKCIDKLNNLEEKIHIGSSNNNIINLNIDLDNFENRIIKNDVHIQNNINYFESPNYKISLHENKHPDQFKIFFYDENNTIYLKRLDDKHGWGQHLMLNLFDIKQNHNFIIYIGSSVINEVYKKVDLTIRKCFIALTTIPSRIKLPIFIENIKDLVHKQTDEIENLFITIPLKYKRFEESIDIDIINELKNIPKVIIVNTDEDFGPASKYLGPLICYYKEVKNNILIVVDDDRKYNKNLVRNFKIAYNSFSHITFSSGLWSDYFNSNYKNLDENYLEFQIHKEYNNNQFHFGQGLGGFFGFSIKVVNIEKFINYNLMILKRIPKSFFHDEGIILGFLKYKEETILYLKHYGCNFIDNELIDALCKSNLVDRGRVEKEILQITNLENI